MIQQIVGQARRILKAPNPRLLSKAVPVLNFQQPEVKQTIEDLKCTMLSKGGAGLSSTQLFSPKPGKRFQVFTLYHGDHDVGPQKEDEIEVVVNPRITKFSKEKEKDEEMCLSIPGLVGEVWRSKEIAVTYQDQQGRRIEKTLSGFSARVFQHEYDHLHGRIILNTAESIWEVVEVKQEKKEQTLTAQEKESNVTTQGESNTNV
eukprot:GILI01028082.1.p1 GENE.GILI01028082.1~~GILI01028082.1.p1  ORF type:complete len:221 (+),score=32.07 GILI01028082.1:54-665(+)